MGESGAGDSGFDVRFEPDVELAVCETAGRTIENAARRIVEGAGAAIAARGRFLLALSGGSTPRPLYETLAAPSWRSQIDWPRVHLLWSDERAVPPDHAESNYRMACEALIDHVPIPATHLHRMHGEENPATAAAAYERTVRTLVGETNRADGEPAFTLDLVLLGLGDDGHTASIFPHRPAGRETTRWVVDDEAPSGQRRLTFTPALINTARAVLFLVIGGGKAAVLDAVQNGPHDPDTLPAQRIAPRHGRLIWLVDAAAASALP